MNYNQLPELVIFDIGGTLFADGPFDLCAGLQGFRNAALNPDVTDIPSLCKLWNEYTGEIDKATKKDGPFKPEWPLAGALRYISMRSGLRFAISMPEQEEIFDRFNSTRSVMVGAPELFDLLERLGIQTGIISNNAMSSQSLHRSIHYYIPNADPLFCLTSSDFLTPKPHPFLFRCAADFAGIAPEKCWYCGDNTHADVVGAYNSAMLPVLLDRKSETETQLRTDVIPEPYLTIRSWNALINHLQSISEIV